MDHECLATLGSSIFLLFLLWNFVGRLKRHLLSCLFHNITEKDNPTKASGMLIVKIFMPIVSLAMALEILVGIC